MSNKNLTPENTEKAQRTAEKHREDIWSKFQ